MTKRNRSRLIAASGVFAIFAALVPATLSGATPIRAGGGPDCTPVLNKPLGGAQAVDALGANIERGAARAGMTVAEFARTLRTDPTLRVDVCGYPFYVEPVAPPDAGRSAPLVEKALDASGNVFALSSRPGSLRTIYLDFNGATVSGTNWNNYAGVASIAAPAFSLDADGSTFTAAEQDIVREVWLRVSEDYAPFDVNVTTADPGFAAINRSSSADNTYGTTALFTNDSVVYGVCGCGGIAYVGIFDLAGSNTYYQPAWVFQRGTGGTAKAMAEAAAHEVGHNLGLSHDGTVAHDTFPASGYYAGHAAWAPIMGVSYYRPVTQWSAGEYAYANNTQDDLAIINSRGLNASDDHGNTAAAASALPTGATVSGIIGTRDDTDWFSFTASGAMRISAIPQTVGPDLDIVLRIYNSAGVLLATADPAVASVDASTATGLDATLTVTLTSGTYYAVVDGAGFGDPLNTGYSDYGSLGRYDISVTIPPLVVATESLPNGTALSAYSATLAAREGTAPYTWSLSAGTLPAGLSLSTAGAISGTPTTPGTSNFTVKVTDAAGASATKALSLVIVPAPLTITTTSLPGGKLKRAYSATLAARGGTSPYTWSKSAGTLPPGLVLSAAGVLSGTPTKASSYTFTVRVVDAAGVAATKSFTVRIVT